MKRTMINTKTSNKLEIVEHIILKNFWEYYVTTDKHSNTIVRCLVLGDETELGDVCLDEIKPYIISRTRDLSDLMPCTGWEWAD